MLLYVSGPYSAPCREKQAENIEAAKAVAAKLWKAGHAVICPHANTAFFEEIEPGITCDQYIQGDLEILERCDGLVLLPNWYESKGSIIEHDHALRNGVPVYQSEAMFTIKENCDRCSRPLMLAEVLG